MFICQSWKHITSARLLNKDTRLTRVEWSADIDCLIVDMPDGEAEKFPDSAFDEHHNRLEFTNDTIQMSWIFHVDKPYERFRPQPDRGATTVSFRLSPKRVFAASK